MGSRKIAESHRKRPNVIMMTMGDNDRVDLFILYHGVKRQALATLPLGVHPGVHQKAAVVDIQQP
jgi:hypothetical protein